MACNGDTFTLPYLLRGSGKPYLANGNPLCLYVAILAPAWSGMVDDDCRPAGDHAFTCRGQYMYIVLYRF